jgi:hypothetical protein
MTKTVKKTQETDLDGPFVYPTGRTRITTSYSTFKEFQDHERTKGSTYLGSDVSYEGTQENPRIVYRAFEIIGKKKARRKS